DGPAGVREDVSRKPSVLVAQHGGSGAQLEIRHLAERDLRSGHGRHAYAAERIEVGAEIARIPDGDRIPLAALHGGGDGQAADRRFDHVLDLADVEAVARGAIAVDVEIEEVPAADALGKRGARSGNLELRCFDPV